MFFCDGRKNKYFNKNVLAIESKFEHLKYFKSLQVQQFTFLFDHDLRISLLKFLSNVPSIIFFLNQINKYYGFDFNFDGLCLMFMTSAKVLNYNEINVTDFPKQWPGVF